MIEVQNLSLSLNGQRILSDISFTLEKLQNLVILGRSGSGKTMLIKTLMGFYKPESGSIKIDGDLLESGGFSKSKGTQQSFAMVFQNAALLDSYTVFQNVALPLYERGDLDFKSICEKVARSLALVGLEDTADKYPAELSGGMRKRIGIARALVYDPKYIIFDEPVSGLDPITCSEVLYYINQIIQNVSATTITVTHDIRNLQDVGNQVLFLENGRSLYYGPIDKLTQCADPLVRQFLCG